MGETPTTSNDTANTINSGIKTSLDTAATIAEGLIIADAPALGWPILKQVWTSIFEWSIGYLSKGLQLTVGDLIIDGQIILEQNAVKKSLAPLIQAQQNGTPDEILKAKKDFANAISALIHYNGDATPK